MAFQFGLELLLKLHLAYFFYYIWLISSIKLLLAYFFNYIRLVHSITSGILLQLHLAHFFNYICPVGILSQSASYVLSCSSKSYLHTAASARQSQLASQLTNPFILWTRLEESCLIGISASVHWNMWRILKYRLAQDRTQSSQLTKRSAWKICLN